MNDSDVNFEQFSIEKVIEKEGKRTIKMLVKCRTCILRQKSQISLLWDSNSRPLDDGRRGKSPTFVLVVRSKMFR